MDISRPVNKNKEIYRCIIIIVITTNQVFTKTDDEITAEWIKNKINNFTKHDEDDNFNLDQTMDPQPLKITEERKQVNDTSKENDDNFSLDPNLGALNLGTPPTEAPTSSPFPEKATNTTDEINLAPLSLEETQECVTADNQRGACVPYYQCDSDDHTIIDDGSSLIDLRSKERVCLHYLQVCCITSKTTPTSSNANIDLTPFSAKLPDSYISDKLDTDTGKCGWNNPALHIFQTTSKEIDDNKIYANYGDFPWMIALIKKKNTTDEWSRNDYLGGGSLIHPAVVLTAAHKVDQFAARELKCRAGEWDTQTTLELYEHQERDVRKIIINKDFFRTSVYNDIALILLKSDFELTKSPNIGVACVGASLPPPGTECFSMGWGKEFKEKNKYAVILKKVRLPLVGAEACEDLLQKTRLGTFFKLHKSLTCAGGEEGVDTCRGDGGSSLVCPIQTLEANTRFAVFGMVAYGIGCGEINVPSVYVNVPHLKPWIDATMAVEGYTSKSYTNYK